MIHTRIFVQCIANRQIAPLIIKNLPRHKLYENNKYKIIAENNRIRGIDDILSPVIMKAKTLLCQDELAFLFMNIRKPGSANFLWFKSVTANGQCFLYIDL